MYGALFKKSKGELMNALNGATAAVTLKLYRKYFDLVRLGTKTIEGRVNETAKFKNLKVGNFIKFVQTEDINISFSAEVIGIRLYPSFPEMLKKEDLKKCLPGCATIEEGIKVYHSIPNFEEQSKEYGVIAMELNVGKNSVNSDKKQA